MKGKKRMVKDIIEKNKISSANIYQLKEKKDMIEEILNETI